MENFYRRSRAYVSFQVRLVPELKDRLMKYSLESGQSQVAIVHRALEQFLDDVDPDPGYKQEAASGSGSVSHNPTT